MTHYSIETAACSKATPKNWKNLHSALIGSYRAKHENWNSKWREMFPRRVKPRSDWESRYLAINPEAASYLGKCWEHTERARKTQNQRDCRARAKSIPRQMSASAASDYTLIEAILHEERGPKADIRSIFLAEQALFLTWLSFDTPRTRQLRSTAREILSARIILPAARESCRSREPSHGEFAAMLSAKVAATTRNAARRRLELLRDLEGPGGPWTNSPGRNLGSQFEQGCEILAGSERATQKSVTVLAI